MCSKVGIELSADIDSRRFARGVLHHEEQLGHDLDDVAGLKDKISLPLDSFRGETAGNVWLTPEFSCRR